MAAGLRGKYLQVVIAVIAWVAVALQFYLIILHRTAGIIETIIRFFSYFTILTNILVAFAFTILAAGKQTGLHRFFSKPSNITAVTVYIIVVGLVYNSILRWLWEPAGLQLYADEALHSITPLLVLLYWLINISFMRFQWKNIISWLIYPFVYLVYVLIRGAFSNFYPYPFLDVSKIGYGEALLNCVYVTFAFLFISLLLTGIGKMRRV
jgi:hypothetical protein